MQYYGLKSVVASQKQSIKLRNPTESFFTPDAKIAPYIEPTFSKEEYPTEKPTILLVSAVGASGKTTTAHALAHDTGLPILDLAIHKPVADNTLTGILTRAYPIDSVGAVLEGIRKGTHGIIIDGIDEGRSKTTEQAFEAFLDDLVDLSKDSPVTSIVIFGRNQALLSTWVYLCDKGVNVGLIQLDPFHLEQAKNYIDAYVGRADDSQRIVYEQARDNVLSKLGRAFSTSMDERDAFLSFVGYPPVLDAIATLLRTELNYHRVIQTLSDKDSDNFEVKLLIEISDLLLTRERNEKALPNFIEDIANDANGKVQKHLQENLYNADEQSARVLANALKCDFPIQVLEDFYLNERYEKAVSSWCPEHPFLQDDRIRNAVFEAVTVARCSLSSIPEYRALALNYTSKHHPTYHLLYILNELTEGTAICTDVLNMLIQSSCEFIGKEKQVTIEVNGLAWDETKSMEKSSADIEIQVSLRNGGQEKHFVFKSIVTPDDIISLGPMLINTAITVPCQVKLQGHPALESIGQCKITAKVVTFDSDVIVRQIQQSSEVELDHGLFLDVDEAQGHSDNVTLKGGGLEIICAKHSLTYPLAQYVQSRKMTIEETPITIKFQRLRRILQEFVSHSKGGLAKFRDKIEHERVLRGTVGASVLAQLLEEGVLYSDNKFYYVDSDKLSSILGTNWPEIRKYVISTQTEAFLRRIP